MLHTFEKILSGNSYESRFHQLKEKKFTKFVVPTVKRENYYEIFVYLLVY